MTAIILPHELIYQVIDEVYNQDPIDLATLSSCSVTARAFFHHCRPLIFRHITLSPPVKPLAYIVHPPRPNPTSRKFHHLLEILPHLASYVRDLTITTADIFEDTTLPIVMKRFTQLSGLHIRWRRRGINDTPRRWNMGPEAFKEALSATLRLATMTCLTLAGMAFGTGSLVGLLSHAPALKHLDLTMAFISRDVDSVPTFRTPTPQLPYPRLEALVLPHRNYLSVLESLLSAQSPQSRASLLKLSIAPEPLALVSMWSLLTDAVGDFLQHLVISAVMIPDLRYNSVDLRGFRSLRSIQMSLSDGMGRSDWDIPTWLAGFFASCESESPLEEIGLVIFFDSIFGLSSSSLGKLDNVLAGPKMASLRELHITPMHRRGCNFDLSTYIRGAMPRLHERRALVIRDRLAYARSNFRWD